MTVYARADLAHTLIPEAFGGCGERHFRPVVDGAPAKLWALDCQDGCENFLRHDPLWSTTTTEVPETYDHRLAREQSEKSGKMDRERQLAEALVQLAPLGDLPNALGQMLSQLMGTTPPAALAGQMECPDGHPNQPGHKFCSQCGQAMSQAVPAAAISAPEKAAAATAAGVDMPGSGRLKDANKKSLQALCRAHNLDDAGTNAELVLRVSNAGLTINDLMRLAGVPVAA